MITKACLDLVSKRPRSMTRQILDNGRLFLMMSQDGVA